MNLGTIQSMRHVGKRIGARVRWEADCSITVRFASGAPHHVTTPEGATALLNVMRAQEEA
jgi:hypothetical protein